MSTSTEAGSGYRHPDMRRLTSFLTAHTQLAQLHDETPVGAEHKYRAELSRLLGQWEAFHPVGRGGNFVDICTPLEETGQQVPVAVKVINRFGSRFAGIERRVEKWATPEDMASAEARVFVPQGVSLSDAGRCANGLLALEHDMCQRLYSPYVIPAEFVSFVPRVDVIEEQAKSIAAEEKQARIEAGALTQDGRRYILQKGVPAVAMVEDYYEDIAGLDGEEPLSPPLRTQLRDMISKLEQAFQLGYYPDPAIARPNGMNLVIANGNQLVLIDSNFLISRREDFAKKDFNGILDALYYFAR